MKELIDFIINNFWVIAGSIIGTAFAGYVAYRNNRKSRAADAVLKFRNKVISELEGLYPITLHWDANTFSHLYSSLSKIECAAAEFRFFVKSKDDFDTAIKNYNEYCRKTTYEEVSADTIFSSMRKEGEIGKREQFKNIVEHLISFHETII